MNWTLDIYQEKPVISAEFGIKIQTGILAPKRRKVNQKREVWQVWDAEKVMVGEQSAVSGATFSGRAGA
jgi:hypothetical protein